jgi:flagellar hook protein FlgE
MLGLIGLAAGMAAGNRETQQRNREQARQDEQDAWTKKEQGRQEQAWGREDKLQRGLASATNKAEVNENGAVLSLADGTKTVYDDADVAGSDFRMLRRADEATGRQTLAQEPMGLGSALNTVAPAPVSVDGVKPAGGLSTPLSTGTSAAPVSADAAPPAAGLAGFKGPMAPQRTATMNGKAYGSLAEAQAAGKAYDTPEAMDKRIGLAYSQSGDPMKAKQYQAATTSQQVSDMALADKAWSRKIGAAMMAPGETVLSGLSKLFSESEFGPMAGKKVKDVLSEDGKMVVMHVINPDGTLTPTGLKFSNDQEGITRAGYMLDQAVTPEHRYTNYVAEKKTKAQADKEAAVFEETKRHNIKREESWAVTAGAAATRAARAGLGAGSGGSAGGKIQKTFVDNEGYMVGVFRDGTSKRLAGEDGQPIRSDSIEKRVDTLAKNLQANSPREYGRMPYAEVRKAAQGILLNEGEAPTAPAGLASVKSKAPAQPAASKTNYSNLWK